MARLPLALLAAAWGAALGDDPVVSGSGRWRYQWVPSRLQLPAGAPTPENGHGLCRDLEGNIYYTFQPHAVGASTQALAKFAPDGTGGELLGRPGPQGLAAGVPHGLRFEHDEELRTGFLYHANNDATVTKTDLQGREIWRTSFHAWQTEKPHFWPVMPTQAAVVPGTDVLLVADGYGSSFVHRLHKRTGEYLNSSFGGRGVSTDPVRFDTPHGIEFDPRLRDGGGGPVFAVSDRSNHRLFWVNASGGFVAAASTERSAGMSLPCNVNVYSDARQGPVAAVPSLGAPAGGAFLGGAVAIYATHGAPGSAGGDLGEPLSVIEVERLIGHLGYQHPHDAIFLENGDLVICCWSGPSDGPQFGPAKGTISYWKRLPEGADEEAMPKFV